MTLPRDSDTFAGRIAEERAARQMAPVFYSPHGREVTPEERRRWLAHLATQTMSARRVTAGNGLAARWPQGVKTEVGE